MNAKEVGLMNSGESKITSLLLDCMLLYKWKLSLSLTNSFNSFNIIKWSCGWVGVCLFYNLKSTAAIPPCASQKMMNVESNEFTLNEV